MAIPNGVTTPGLSFGEAGTVKATGRAITVTAGQLTLNALLDVCVVPAGFTVTGVQLRSTDIDTGGSPAVVLAVGDTGDDDRLVTGSTVGQAGTASNTLAATGVAYQYTSATTIQVKVTTAPATAAGGTITVLVFGVLD